MKIPLTWKGNLMDSKTYEYETVICEADGKGGAYVAFPYDVREEFGRGREKVHVTFDGVPYDGSVVKKTHPVYLLIFHKFTHFNYNHNRMSKP